MNEGSHATAGRLAFSVEEAARALGIGRTQLYYEIREGRLRAVKCGRRTLIRRSDAEAWLDLLTEEERNA